MIFALLFLALLSVRAQDLVMPDSEHNFRPMEEQWLIFPMTNKDFNNWQTEGSAVFLRNHLVVSPGSKNLKGLVYNTNPTSTGSVKGWIAEFDLDLGNDDLLELGSGGLAIYFLRNFDPDQRSGLYGYTNKFDGVAVIVSTLVKQRVQKEYGLEFHSSIQGFDNDGSHNINLLRRSSNQCFAKINGQKGEVFRVRLEYESDPAKTLHVSFFSQETMQFERCFAWQIDLEYQGIWAVSAASGMRDPDHHHLRSIKLWDTSQEVLNNHYQDSHQRKALTEQLADKLSQDVNDLIHMSASADQFTEE